MASSKHRNIVQRYEKECRYNVLAKPGPHQFVLVLDHLKPGFNVAKIFRSAEAFGASEVHMVGIGPFDPAPAKGSFRKVPVTFHDNIDACLTELIKQGYTLFVLQPSGGLPLCKANLPEKSGFIFGHEEFGISIMPEENRDLKTLTIPQFGAGKSLNVSIAASVVMYQYISQWSV